ncbi:DUF421 domain-containing protein [Pseudogracilibacillus auburnensis]|uniref:Uncharacterized membrane protein YcaP (DUF421 family) n=1 Tax=Pseudogracilibacillus auburnensis TaxID=1494959 RepID=A0A2V3VW97_9BACI|nr:DUF421 domain-containing protein [Pseudogracilibacillus auburnensis]PXW86217.1 uncharacterized membrane protein YcaP (DUF421 family) [Pseudogracilibacillus auburnensis]
MIESFVVVVRAIIAFFTLLIFTRILGKQQISQLSFFDYITGITIGSIAATLTTDLTSRAWPHWVGLFLWTLLVFIFQWITLKGRNIAKYIDGEPAIVILKGKIMEDTLKKTRYRAADLLKLLRSKDVFEISEVEYAVLETSGELSILKKAESLPLTPKDIGLLTSYKGISRELIYDGKVMEQNLNYIGKDEKWLLNQIRSNGFGSFDEVFLVLIDESNKLFIDGYRDSRNEKEPKTLE